MSEFTESARERIEHARIVLEALGMDAERSNERSALVLLALLQLSPTTTWSECTNPMLGTRAIMDFILHEYGREYAANTREKIRRFTLHQFIGAHLVIENPDEPQRPVNSPKWNYQVTNDAVRVLRTYGTAAWSTAIEAYLGQLPGLKAQYAAARKMARIPLTLANRSTLTLTPGGQNVLLKAMVEDFCPRFTPGGRVLYLGDAGDKWAVFDREGLAALSVLPDEHGKMPDLVVYVPEQNWLVLLEAVSSHGPVDTTRRAELTNLFAGTSARLVFVSCFASRAAFRKYVDKIAWESDVWCADHPTHIVHFNGDGLLAPHS